MTIFFKKSQHFLSSKRHFLCMFNPKFDKNCSKCAKKSIFPPIFAWNNWFSQETQAIWKKLKQLLGKTQENIQKLKQNEHQVLSCSQKKCKIKPPGIYRLRSQNSSLVIIQGLLRFKRLKFHLVCMTSLFTLVPYYPPWDRSKKSVYQATLLWFVDTFCVFSDFCLVTCLSY